MRFVYPFILVMCCLVQPMLSQKRNTMHKVNSSASWTLERCVRYARENNLQIQNSVLNERLTKLQLAQSINSQLPGINADATLGDSYGRSIDPTSNQFVTKGFIYNTLGLNSQALVFGWFQRKHQIEKNRLDLQSVGEANDQLKDDISLNVATGFLRVLLAREQVKVAEALLVLDEEQYQQTVKFANAGKIPELNVSQMLSQLASDSAGLVSNRSEEQLALLQLRALLNFDFEKPFELESPDMDAIELSDTYAFLTPEDIFNTAVKNQHRMRFNQLNIESAKKSLAIAKSSQYPQLSIFGSLGTNFSSNVQNITGQTQTGEQAIGNVNVNGTLFPITIPTYSYSSIMKPIFDQYGENIRANAGVSLTIPILNGRSAHFNIERARIGILTQEISSDQDKQKLKQDIYTAQQQVIAARQKYSASVRAQEASKRALDFAVKRYAIGMITPFEYTSILNRYNTACSSALSAKYDLIFKLKVIDYYMGNPLKL